MKKLGLLFSVVLAFCACLVGCKTAIPETDATKGTKVYTVVVGMENSRFAGQCTGAGYDADRMYKLLSKYSTNIVLFRDSNATKGNVVAALNRAVAEAGDGLVIFFYSGHGGSEPFFDTDDTDEKDGRDEFYCLWDTYLKDNEMWSIISKSKGRVFLLNDCCHSESIYRSMGIRMSPPLSWDHTLDEHRQFSMLCWSGCPDDTYSYGAATGGQFTNALLRYFDDSLTYEALWGKIKKDKVLRRFENPQSTILGDGFENKAIFR